MTIQTNAPFQVSDDLQNLVNEKVNKLSTYFEKIESVTVFFRDEDNSSHATPTANTTEIRLIVPGHTLYAQETSESFEKSLVAASEKMRKQLIRYKEQLVPYVG